MAFPLSFSFCSFPTYLPLYPPFNVDVCIHSPEPDFIYRGPVIRKKNVHEDSVQDHCDPYEKCPGNESSFHWEAMDEGGRREAEAGRNAARRGLVRTLLTHKNMLRQEQERGKVKKYLWKGYRKNVGRGGLSLSRKEGLWDPSAPSCRSIEAAW